LVFINKNYVNKRLSTAESFNFVGYNIFKFMRFLLIFFLGTALFSCKKKTGEYEISGLVVDSSSASGLKFVEIEVYESVSGISEPKLLTTTVTDKEGHYSVKIERDRINYLIFKVSKANYFPLEKILYFSDLTLTETNVLHLGTTAKSWAKIHIKSNSPSNNLSIIKTKGKKDCDECCPEGYQNFSGMFDTTFYCMNDGNTEYAFTYFMNGGSLSGVRSGITPSFDTLMLELDF